MRNAQNNKKRTTYVRGFAKYCAAGSSPQKCNHERGDFTAPSILKERTPNTRLHLKLWQRPESCDYFVHGYVYSLSTPLRWRPGRRIAGSAIYTTKLPQVATSKGSVCKTNQRSEHCTTTAVASKLGVPFHRRHRNPWSGGSNDNAAGYATSCTIPVPVTTYRYLIDKVVPHHESRNNAVERDA